MAKTKKESTENNDQKFDLFIKDITKVYGENGIKRIGDSPKNKLDTLDSGSYLVNNVLGGGYPYGRVTEIFGGEASGKTTLCLMAIKSAQDKGERCVIIDSENAFNRKYAEDLNINVDDLYIAQPEDSQTALDLIQQLAVGGHFPLIILDSIAALVPKQELEGQSGDSNMGVQARLMSQAFRKLVGVVNKNNICVIMVNQERSKIGVMWGSNKTTTGGNATKYYSSIRLNVANSGKIKSGDEIIGQKIKVRGVKNKVYIPFRECETNFYYGKGINKDEELINLAIENGLIKKSGSWFSYDGTNIGQGINGVLSTFEDNPDLKDEIIKKLEE